MGEQALSSTDKISGFSVDLLHGGAFIGTTSGCLYLIENEVPEQEMKVIWK